MISNEELIEKLQCTRADCTNCPMHYEEQVEQDLYRCYCAARDAAISLARLDAQCQQQATQLHDVLGMLMQNAKAVPAPEGALPELPKIREEAQDG